MAARFETQWCGSEPSQPWEQILLALLQVLFNLSSLSLFSSPYVEAYLEIFVALSHPVFHRLLPYPKKQHKVLKLPKFRSHLYAIFLFMWGYSIGAFTLLTAHISHVWLARSGWAGAAAETTQPTNSKPNRLIFSNTKVSNSWTDQRSHNSQLIFGPTKQADHEEDYPTTFGFLDFTLQLLADFYLNADIITTDMINPTASGSMLNMST